MFDKSTVQIGLKFIYERNGKIRKIFWFFCHAGINQTTTTDMMNRQHLLTVSIQFHCAQPMMFNWDSYAPMIWKK